MPATAEPSQSAQEMAGRRACAGAEHGSLHAANRNGIRLGGGFRHPALGLTCAHPSCRCSPADAPGGHVEIASRHQQVATAGPVQPAQEGPFAARVQTAQNSDRSTLPAAMASASAAASVILPSVLPAPTRPADALRPTPRRAHRSRKSPTSRWPPPDQANPRRNGRSPTRVQPAQNSDRSTLPAEMASASAAASAILPSVSPAPTRPAEALRPTLPRRTLRTASRQPAGGDSRTTTTRARDSLHDACAAGAELRSLHAASRNGIRFGCGFRHLALRLTCAHPSCQCCPTGSLAGHSEAASRQPAGGDNRTTTTRARDSLHDACAAGAELRSLHAASRNGIRFGCGFRHPALRFTCAHPSCRCCPADAPGGRIEAASRQPAGGHRRTKPTRARDSLHDTCTAGAELRSLHAASRNSIRFGCRFRHLALRLTCAQPSCQCSPANGPGGRTDTASRQPAGGHRRTKPTRAGHGVRRRPDKTIATALALRLTCAHRQRPADALRPTPQAGASKPQVANQPVATAGPSQPAQKMAFATRVQPAQNSGRSTPPAAMASASPAASAIVPSKPSLQPLPAVLPAPTRPSDVLRPTPAGAPIPQVGNQPVATGPSQHAQEIAFTTRVQPAQNSDRSTLPADMASASPAASTIVRSKPSLQRLPSVLPTPSATQQPAQAQQIPTLPRTDSRPANALRPTPPAGTSKPPVDNQPPAQETSTTPTATESLTVPVAPAPEIAATLAATDDLHIDDSGIPLKAATPHSAPEQAPESAQPTRPPLRSRTSRCR
jgi:hypothetical protein